MLAAPVLLLNGQPCADCSHAAAVAATPMSGFFDARWLCVGGFGARPFPLVHLSNSNGVVTSLRHLYIQCGCCRASQCAERDALHMGQRVTAQ